VGLVNDVITRCWLTYLLLDIMLHLKDPIKKLFYNKIYDDASIISPKIKSVTPTSAEPKNVGTVKKIIALLNSQ
jgi:hypothetical protein